RSVQLAESRPGVRGLERLDHRPHPHQRVAQVGPLVAAVLPGPPRRLPEVGGAARPQRPDGEGAAARHRLLLPLQPDDQQPPLARTTGAPPRGPLRRRRGPGKSRPWTPRGRESASEPAVSSSSETRITSGRPGPCASVLTISAPASKLSAIHAS